MSPDRDGGDGIEGKIDLLSALAEYRMASEIGGYESTVSAVTWLDSVPDDRVRWLEGAIDDDADRWKLKDCSSELEEGRGEDSANENGTGGTSGVVLRIVGRNRKCGAPDQQLYPDNQKQHSRRVLRTWNLLRLRHCFLYSLRLHSNLVCRLAFCQSWPR